MKTLIQFACVTVGLAMLFSCERDFTYRGGSQGLSISTDTVMFDTIFTAFGSVTKSLKVYNPYDEDLTIGEISLAGGDESNFRININGSSESQLNEIRIRSKDSLYIFVEVTIDPAGINNPFVVSDSLIFITQERIQQVKLVAYGQDVVLLKKEKLQTQTFTNDRPYLIYDYVIVDSLQKLTIEPGTRLYFHNDASLLVFGELEVKGTMEEPVIFEGDRLEKDYSDIPGQWGYIHFFPGSKNITINHSIIRNGLMGIRADSVGLGTDAPMIISNSRFEHISSIGLLAESSRIVVTNSLFGDCGVHSVALTVGGNYEFTHCTIARGYNWGHLSSTPALLLNNYFIDENKVNQIIPLEKATFSNCIIYGENYTELGFDFKEIEGELVDNGIHYYFDHCLIKSGSIKVTDPEHFNKVIANKDPNFEDWDTGHYDYRLDTLSVAKDTGRIEPANLVPFDFLGVSRLEDKGPDLGIYERVEKEQ